jgi:uncharacterized protein (TIGR02300 family)
MLLTAPLQAAKGNPTFSGLPVCCKDSDVAKPELGTKRLCGNCGAKFYDLSKDPIVCPKCSTVFQVVAPVTRARPDAAAGAAAAAAAAAAAVAAAAAARAAAAPAAEAEPETQDAEFVSLEEADAEASGSKKAPAEGEADIEGEDVEIEGDEALDDSTFIEETEEGDEDVTDIIGEGREDEEET